MNKLTKLISNAIPLRKENVDTDQIIPARFLKAISREGFGEKLFHNWRFDEEGEKKEHILHDPRYEGAKKLLVGRDFGIGSSREHAVWALYDYGFRAVIGSTFADIFYNNSIKNGLLIVRLQSGEVERMFRISEDEPRSEYTVHIAKQEIYLPDGTYYTFEIDSFHKKMIIHEMSDIDWVYAKEDKIKKFEANERSFLVKSR